MNKKKIASLLLVGSLLIGGGVLGAKAWFSAQTQVSSNLKVTTGTLKVKADNINEANGGWVLQKTEDKWGNEQTEAVTGVVDANGVMNYTNVRPGDSFIKEVTIKNTGSLKERLKFTVNKPTQEQYKDVIHVAAVRVESEHTTSDLSTGASIVLEPEESMKVRLHVEIRDTMPGHSVNGKLDQTNSNWQDTTLDLSGVLGDKELITVTGHQLNEPIK